MLRIGMRATEPGFKLGNHHGGEMKKIGILGGMSPESTTLYYEHITRTYTARFGDYGYPEILIYSVNFQKFVDWQHNGQWNEAAGEMADALERLHVAGADVGLIATNTMHIVFDEVQRAVHMPLLSIVQATAEAIHAAGLRSVGLLGTVFTMTERFFRDGLERWGIKVLVPQPSAQQRINDVIYKELCKGDELSATVSGNHRVSTRWRRPGYRPGVHRDPIARGTEAL
jgi:aspartate racemase